MRSHIQDNVQEKPLATSNAVTDQVGQVIIDDNDSILCLGVLRE